MPGKSYNDVTAASVKKLELVVKNRCPWIKTEKVIIRWLSVHPPRDADNEIIAPALTLAGCTVAAKIKLCSARDRVLTGSDVILETAADIWGVLNERQQEALLAHELEHLVLRMDKDGKTPLRDQFTGRVKLNMRPDDYLLTGFYDVAKEYGRDSMEVGRLAYMLHNSGIKQYVFDFVKELANPKNGKGAKTKKSKVA